MMARGHSELARAVRRITSNYARLGTNLLLGIVLLPILIGGVGPDGYGLWGLLGATVGLADMFREMLRSSMYRELGHAWHDPDPATFPKVYNTALALCAALAVLTALIFAGLYLVVPVLNIAPAWQPAARLVVVALGFSTAVTVLLSPALNMFVVTERMVLFNTFTVCERLCYTAVAVVLFLGLGVADPQRGLVLFSFITTAAVVLTLSAFTALILRLEPALRPRPGLMDAGALRSILGTGGWNMLTVMAMNLHTRVGQLIVNLAFGLVANAVYTLALTLTAYVRMLTIGVTDGLETVSVRLSRQGGAESLARLTEYSTRLHAAVALPAGLTVVALAEPLLSLWVGRHVQDPGVIARAAAISQILALGLTSRAISDSWMRILYGAGHVRRYAKFVFAGGLVNPVLAIALLLLPAPWDLAGPAFATAVLITGLHLFGLPVIVARCLGVSYGAVLRPMLRPLGATLVCAPMFLLLRGNAGSWDLVRLAVAFGGFWAPYALLAAFVVLRADERRRLLSLVLPKRRAGAPAESPAPAAADPARIEA